MEIVLNDKAYKARKPKVKIYKKLMQLQTKMPDNDAWSTPEGLDAAIEILVDAMGDPLITAERIENEMDADALMPALEAVVQWITGTFESADLGEPGRR